LGLQPTNMEVAINTSDDRTTVRIVGLSGITAAV
jgi:hypothetical protein